MAGASVKWICSVGGFSVDAGEARGEVFNASHEKKAAFNTKKIEQFMIAMEAVHITTHYQPLFLVTAMRMGMFTIEGVKQAIEDIDNAQVKSALR